MWWHRAMVWGPRRAWSEGNQNRMELESTSLEAGMGRLSIPRWTQQPQGTDKTPPLPRYHYTKKVAQKPTPSSSHQSHDESTINPRTTIQRNGQPPPTDPLRLRLPSTAIIPSSPSFVIRPLRSRGAHES